MNIRKKQQMSLFFWRRYSATLDRINRNALNKEFAMKNQTVLSFPNRSEQWRYLYQEILEKAPIDYLEFGVFRGDSIREWINLSISPHSRFYGFDTFTGLPEHWFKNFSKSTFNVDGKIPDITDSRVTFVKGTFQDTVGNFLNGFSRKNRIVVHIDADLYSSTLFVLLSMHYYLKEGDIILFDDFLDPLGEFMAFNNYCQAFRISPKLISGVKYGELFDKVAFMVISAIK
jgi:hypothetical protein